MRRSTLLDAVNRPTRIILYALIAPSILLLYRLLVFFFKWAFDNPRGESDPATAIEQLFLVDLLAFVLSLGLGMVLMFYLTRRIAGEIRSLVTDFRDLQITHEGLLHAVDRGPIGLLWVSGESGKIRYLNPAWCHLLGWPAAAVCLGHRASEIDPDGVAAVNAEARARLAAGESWSVRRDIVVGGEFRRLDFTTVPLPADGTEGPSVLVFVEDCSSQAERDELRARHAGASAALPGLAASVAASRGLLELALRDPLLPGPLRADLGAIRDGTAETARLLDPFNGRASA